MKVEWSPLASQRALEAIDYIASERPQAAIAWLDQLLSRVGQLKTFPRRGRVVREIGHPAYRELIHPPYRIIYRLDASRVVVLTLRHSRRAWDPGEVVGDR